MVAMTLNDLYAKVKVIHFGTNWFLIYDLIGDNLITTISCIFLLDQRHN